jgi:hypothetical protein
MKKFLILMMLVFTHSAFAGSDIGKVQFQDSQYQSSSSTAGYTFFKLAGTKSNPPTCASSN